MFPLPKMLEELQCANHCDSNDMKILRSLSHAISIIIRNLSQDRPNLLPLFQGLLEATAMPNTPANINQQVPNLKL